MKLSKLKSALLGGAMIAATMTVGLSAPAAQAATCNPYPGGSSRYPIATIDMKLAGSTLGQLYIGYIPDCRYEYAEAHFTAGNGVDPIAGSAHIWLQDAGGNSHGTDIYASNLDMAGGWFGSNMIPIDTNGLYYLSEAHLAVSSVKSYIGTPKGGTGIPLCPSTTYISGSHNWYNGNTTMWTDHTTC